MADVVKVVRDGRFVTVRVGGLTATREYSDPWCAKRYTKKLLASPQARARFFKKLADRKVDRVAKETSQ